MYIQIQNCCPIINSRRGWRESTFFLWMKETPLFGFAVVGYKSTHFMLLFVDQYHTSFIPICSVWFGLAIATVIFVKQQPVFLFIWHLTIPHLDEKVEAEWVSHPIPFSVFWYLKCKKLLVGNLSEVWGVPAIWMSTLGNLGEPTLWAIPR